MGKKKRRLLKKKFATLRQNIGLEQSKESSTNIEDTSSGMEIVTTKDLIEESKSDIIVVKNKEPENIKEDSPTVVLEPELQLQQVEVTEKKPKPNGLKRTATKRSTTKKAATAKKTTTRKRRTTKTKTD